MQGFMWEVACLSWTRVKAQYAPLMGYSEGSAFAYSYRGVRYAVVHEEDSDNIFVVWAAPTVFLQSLLCAGLCSTPFAVRAFPSTASLDTLRFLNAKKRT